MNKEYMIKEILIVCKVNNVFTSGDLFFQLAFMNEGQLRKVCSDLHINTK